MRILFAGGGTGGHLFPGIALMEEFERAGVREFLFVGSKRGMDSRLMRDLNIPCRTLPMTGFKGKGLIDKGLSMVRLIISSVIAAGLVLRFRPHIVIGLGGYTALPVVLSASLLGRRTVILEQNLIPGLTNRILSHFADRIFLSFEESLRYFPRGKAVFAGNPVRRELLEGEGPCEGEGFTILVFGGSQGARGINRLMVEACHYLEDLKDSIRIIHQTGGSGRGAVEEAYRKRGFTAEVVEFIRDMGSAYRRSSLVVSRGGATTIAELTALGKPSIIIPFPYAADNHQEWNALYLEKHGASRVLREGETDGKGLAEAIRELYHNRTLLSEMGKRAKALGRPEAGSEIVRDLLCLEEGCMETITR